MAGKTILIVEDNKAIVDLLTKVLSLEGHTVLNCGNGEEALKLLKTEQPHLIILDINMPKMGGVAFFHAIAGKLDGKPKYPVLVLTAREELQDIFADFQVDGFIAKPFQLEVLTAKVDEVLKARYGAADARRQAKTAAKKMIVIENETDSFDEIVHLFLPRSIEIKRIKDGSELPAALKSFPADLVLFKVAEPSLQGDELIMAARARKILWPKVVPVVMFTYRKIPVTPEELEQVIQSTGVYAVLGEATPALLLEYADRIFSDDKAYSKPPS